MSASFGYRESAGSHEVIIHECTPAQACNVQQLQAIPALLAVTEYIQPLWHVHGAVRSPGSRRVTHAHARVARCRHTKCACRLAHSQPAVSTAGRGLLPPACAAPPLTRDRRANVRASSAICMQRQSELPRACASLLYSALVEWRPSFRARPSRIACTGCRQGYGSGPRTWRVRGCSSASCRDRNPAKRASASPAASATPSLAFPPAAAAAAA